MRTHKPGTSSYQRPASGRQSSRRFSLVGAAVALAGSLATLGAGSVLRAEAAAPAGVAQAAAAVKAAEQLPSFQVPGPPVPMPKLRGKNIWIITSTLTVPFVASIAQGAEQAAKLVGWHVHLVNGEGVVSNWSKALEEAVAEHAAGVISIAASPVVMKSAMAKARAAGVPVEDVLTADEASPLVPGTFAHVSISFYRSGQLQADYVIANSNGSAHVLIFGDNEFPGEVTRVQGMEQQFRTLCPKCKWTFQDTQVGSLSTSLPGLTETLLRRDPSVTWVLPTYDAQALYIVPAILSAHETDVKVVSSDAVASNLAWVASKHVEIADVGEPDVWTGWASVDEMGRALAHMKPVDEKIPLRMFIPSNLRGLSFSNETQLWGGSYIKEYKRLWGLG
jgi:ribose transport system substrate-binding protein